MPRRTNDVARRRDIEWRHLSRVTVLLAAGPNHTRFRPIRQIRATRRRARRPVFGSARARPNVAHLFDSAAQPFMHAAENARARPLFARRGRSELGARREAMEPTLTSGNEHVHVRGGTLVLDASTKERRSRRRT